MLVFVQLMDVDPAVPVMVSTQPSIDVVGAHAPVPALILSKVRFSTAVVAVVFAVVNWLISPGNVGRALKPNDVQISPAVKAAPEVAVVTVEEIAGKLPTS